MARRKGADRWRSFCCGSFVSILLALMLLVTTNDETFSGLHHSLRTTFETFIGKTHAPGDSGLALAKADYHGFPHAADGAGGAGQAAVPAPLPHSETVPLPSTRPNAPPPRDRVLVVQNLREGLGAYPDGLIEMFKLARRLRRWIVEPCIRNGCVMFCRRGLVYKDIPPFDQARADRGEDPLLLPFVEVVCDMNMDVKDPYNNHTMYPISAYFDLDYLKETYWPYVIPYEEWFDEYLAADRTKTLLAPHPTLPGNRVIQPRVYCYDFGEQACVHDYNNKPFGDFVFEEARFGRKYGTLDSYGALDEDEHPAVFIISYYRNFYYNPGPFLTPHINKWHVAAVQRYIDQKMHGEKFVAFHWRHSFAKPERLMWCAEQLMTAAKAMPEVNKENSHAVLLVDMPSPGHNASMWNDVFEDKTGIRQQVVAYMMQEGMNVYPSTIRQQVDSGILSIRDYLLAVMSDLYIVCPGNTGIAVCKECVKEGSNFFQRIIADRKRAGKPFYGRWMELPDHPEIRLGPSPLPMDMHLMEML